MYGFFQTTFYFGYMALFSLSLGIMCGESIVRLLRVLHTFWTQGSVDKKKFQDFPNLRDTKSAMFASILNPVSKFSSCCQTVPFCSRFLFLFFLVNKITQASWITGDMAHEYERTLDSRLSVSKTSRGFDHVVDFSGNPSWRMVLLNFRNIGIHRNQSVRAKDLLHGENWLNVDVLCWLWVNNGKFLLMVRLEHSARDNMKRTTSTVCPVGSLNFIAHSRLLRIDVWIYLGSS